MSKDGTVNTNNDNNNNNSQDVPYSTGPDANPNTKIIVPLTVSKDGTVNTSAVQRFLHNIETNTALSGTVKDYLYSLIASHRYIPEHTDCLNYLAPSSKCTKERNCGCRHNFTLYKLIKDSIVKPYELPRCISWLQKGDCPDGATCVHYHPSVDLLPYIADENNILNSLTNEDTPTIMFKTLRTIPLTVPRDIGSVPINTTVETATFHIFWDTENCSLPWAASPAVSSNNDSTALSSQQPVIASGAEVMAALEQILRVITGYQKVHLDINAFHRQNLPPSAKVSLQFVGVKLHDCGNKNGAVDTGIFNALLDFVLNKRLEPTDNSSSMNNNNGSTNLSSTNNGKTNILTSSLRLSSPFHRPVMMSNGTVPKEWVVLISGDRDFRGIQSIRDKLNIPTILFHGPNIHSDLHFICDTIVPWSLVTNHANFTKFSKLFPNAVVPPHRDHTSSSSSLKTGRNGSIPVNGIISSGSSLIPSRSSISHNVSTGSNETSTNNNNNHQHHNHLIPTPTMNGNPTVAKNLNIPVLLKFKNEIILDPTITFTATRLMTKDYQNYERTGVLPTRVRKACRVCAFFLGEKCTKGDLCGFLHPCPQWNFERMEGCSHKDLCPYDHILPMHYIAPSTTTVPSKGGNHHSNVSNARNNTFRVPMGPRGDTSFLTRAVALPSAGINNSDNSIVRGDPCTAAVDPLDFTDSTNSTLMPPSSIPVTSATVSSSSSENSNLLISRSSSLSSNPVSLVLTRTGSDQSSDEETKDVTNEENNYDQSTIDLASSSSSAAASVPLISTAPEETNNDTVADTPVPLSAVTSSLTIIHAVDQSFSNNAPVMENKEGITIRTEQATENTITKQTNGVEEADVDDINLYAMLKIRTNSNTNNNNNSTNSPKINNGTNISKGIPVSPSMDKNDIPSKYVNPKITPAISIRKTVICRHFQRTGYCARGNACGFAHGEEELYQQQQKQQQQPYPSVAQEPNGIRYHYPVSR